MVVFSRRRSGITLVEVLVTMAIIGILISLLMPAVTAARSAARKAQCSNNLKQLALAVQQHHQRLDALPPYWGMEKSNSTKFGGWLLHILPDLGQQVLYDSLPDSVQAKRYKWQKTGRILDPVPPSDDYVPGTWVTTKVGEANVQGTLIPIYKTELVGRKGHPGYPAREEWVWVEDAGNTLNQGLPSDFGAKQANASFPNLGCLEDGSNVPPDAKVDGLQNAKWSLTNYVANAHPLAKFGARFDITSSTSASDNVYVGLFRPAAAWPNQNQYGVGYWAWNFEYNNAISGHYGMQARRNEHIGDGLSNTILFAETMRQCDGGNTYRFALLPCGYQIHEHAFGIEPSYPDAATNTTIYAGSALNRTFGHTLMFQSEPSPRDCNPMRTQAMHGPYLMTAMCDGSVRAISSTVSRKEAIGANATGRDGFARFGSATSAINIVNNPDPSADPGFWTPESRLMGKDGSQNFERPDGIWDLLMLPNDPVWRATVGGTPVPQVLSNSGEVGKDK